MPVRVQIVVEQVVANELSVNTISAFSALEVSPLLAATAEELSDAVDVLYTGTSAAATPNRGIRDSRPNDLRLVRIVVREILAGGTPGVFYEFSKDNLGTNAGDTLPLQLAAVATLRTATAGRSGRGRLFFGPFTETLVAETLAHGQWVPSIPTDIANSLDDLDTRFEAIIPNAFSLAVWSRKDDVHRVVTSVRVDSKVDVLRRRANKVTATTFATQTL
jgi:hypothetical protein